jgi:hypothetical protein
VIDGLPAIDGRRQAVTATEGCREARGLAVADEAGDAGHGDGTLLGEQFGGHGHAPGEQILGERAPEAGVRTLELAGRGGERLSYYHEGELPAVVALDDHAGKQVEATLRGEGLGTHTLLPDGDA